MNKWLIKVFSLALIVVFGIFVFSDSQVMANEIKSIDASVEGSKEENTERKSLFFDTDVITQEDYEQGFLNYSQTSVDFSDSQVFRRQGTANVVGVVKDYDDDSLVFGATIFVDGKEILTTCQDGRFQMKNVPNGKYDWTIVATGYYLADYVNYDVCSTTCCQVYDPTKVTQVAVDATANIFYTAGGVNRTDVVMYKPSSTTYDYIWGAFFRTAA